MLDMRIYKSRQVKYQSKKGEMIRVDYSYQTPDGVTHRSCKRGFLKEMDATQWQFLELPKLIKALSSGEEILEPTPVIEITQVAESGQEPIEEIDPIQTMTFDELVKEFIELRVSKRKPSTQATKLNIINQKILPYFTGRKVVDIKPVDIEKWQAVINKTETAEGYGLSDTYKYTIRGQMTTIMNYAVDIHGLLFNPVKRTEKIGKKKAPKQSFWELSDYAKFRKAIADKPSYFYAFEVLYWTGIRSGELKVLRLRDIDFKKNLIRVYKTKQDSKIADSGIKLSKKEAKKLKDGESTPKTDNSIRLIHIPQILADELKEYVSGIYGLKPDDHIFNLSKSGMHRELDRGIEIAGIEDITVHGVRHSANSLLSNVIECPDVIRKYRLGHSDDTTNDIYNHPYSYKLEEVAEKMNKIMEEMENVCEE